MTDLTNKIAVVTGASSGIGAAIVKEFLASGMKVVGLARRKEKVEQLGEGYEGCLFALETDISKDEDILSAFAWTLENVGPVDVLINNAGINVSKAIEDAEVEEFKNVISTNLLGAMLCTREAIKIMKAHDIAGTIVNISSVAGDVVCAIPCISLYTASKNGLRGFNDYIRTELAKTGSKIRITNLSPGLVATEMAAPYMEGRNFIRVEDIAAGVKFVVSQPGNVNHIEYQNTVSNFYIFCT
ncbi:dehydrogenase [Oryctes borbonicus]|uniref:Dehydrogenase n=1 Tax=Oryctes borbonicus TaxID=1629725 RepID=A0A0T6BGX0_9SCAR|nr:dehydrogenase [Oryctes borbonicus]